MVPIMFGMLASADPLSPPNVDARIEQHRKADAKVVVRGADGKALSGASVRVEMVRHRFNFGCNAFPVLGHDDADREALYQKRFTDVFNFATLGFYWGSYERAKGEKQEERLMRQAKWLKERGITVKGHPLVWHEVYPAWAPKLAEEAQPLLEARITEIVGKFKGVIDMWDVVNEAQVSPDFENGVGAWVKRDGAAKMVDHCLKLAHKTNPNATLLYNDYKVDEGLLTLLKELQKAKSPFQAVGLQSHMHPGETPLEQIWERCETFRQIGLPLHFTELTVISGKHGWMLKPWPDEDGGEERQEAYVAKLYPLLFSHPSVEAIVWWDLMDGAWMGAPAGLLHRDYSPKPAYETLRKLIREKWWTRESGETGTDGVYAFRGFQGTYRIIVQKGGEIRTVEAKLEPGSNTIEIPM